MAHSSLASRIGYQPYKPSPINHHRRSSLTNYDYITTIDEDREHDFSDTRPLTRPLPAQSSLSRSKPGQSDSILRQISVKLLAAPTAYRSLSSRRSRYSNVSSHEHEVVDISTLAGLGIEMHDMPGQHLEGRDMVEDTAYHGVDPSIKPSFVDFCGRSKLGTGMVIATELKHHPSYLSQSSSRETPSDHLKRIKTVRRFGQDLAQQKGQMIAYNEGVDLSSLEGAGIRHRSSRTFDDMSVTRAGTMTDTRSYFFPSDPEIPNWKPFSMRLPYMLFLAGGAFGLAGFQEYLCQASARMQSENPKSALLAFDSVDNVSVWNFFLWKYMPTMITIVYSVLYSITDFDIRRLEPYYQLSKPCGARASASLNLDHLTMFQYFIPFNAARLGQWTVFVSTIANIVAATVAPALQNPSVNFEPNAACNNDSCPESAGKRFWVLIDPTWSRILTASYVYVGLSVLFLIIQLRRKSGLLSDPKGIAGIASMATKSHILHDFQGTDMSTRKDIHDKLAHRTYVLYKSSIWQGEFSLQRDTKEFHDSERRLRSPHPIMLQLSAGIPFIIVMIVCLACVPLISVTGARVVPNAAPWLPILVATILKLVWTTFEADVRLIEPFYQLSKGHAKPEHSLTLDYQSSVYGWMPIRAALNGHFLVALVGLSTVFLDILSVTIGSFSVDSVVFLKGRTGNEKAQDSSESSGVGSQDESYASFWASLGLSIGILVFVIAVACLVYARRRHPFLPREPSTIAAVLSFIYSSKMLADFIDTELLDSKQMEARLKGIGKRYALGWFRGRDGKVHCAIDEEPMISKYVHGQRYGDSVSGPLTDI